MIKLFNFTRRLPTVLHRKFAWQRYAWLAHTHGFDIKRHVLNENCEYLYLNESPFTITEVDGIDLCSDKLKDKVIYSNFDKPKDCRCRQWYNKGAWLSLMDQHVSMPDEVCSDNGNRINKAILVRSAKITHPGHVIRAGLKINGFLDIIDTNTRKISDLRAIYQKYRYALIIENVKYPGYVSEQIWGAIKSGCIPIYYGDFDKLREYKLSNVIDFEKVCSDDYSFISELPAVSDPYYATKNFTILKDIRAKSLGEFMAYPTMFLIRGNR